MTTDQLRADADCLEALADIYRKSDRLYAIAQRLRDAATALDTVPTSLEWNGEGWFITSGKPTI